MLCRNRLTDFARWESVFRSHTEAHEQAGLRLLHLWRGVDEPNNVFFMFEVASIEKAQEFVSTPEAAQVGEAAGVVDGEYHFVEDPGGY